MIYNPISISINKSYLNTIVGNILVLDHVEISILMFGFQI